MKKTFKSIAAIFMIVLTLFSCCSVVLAADKSESAVTDDVYDEDGNKTGYKTITVGDKVYYDIFDGEQTLDGTEPLDFYWDVITKENANGDSALESWSTIADNVFRISGPGYGYNVEYGNYDTAFANDEENVSDNNPANADIHLRNQFAQTNPYSSGVPDDHCVRATGLQSFYSLDSVQDAMLDQITTVCDEQSDAEDFKEQILEHCSLDETGFDIFKDTKSQPVLAHIVSSQYDYDSLTTYRYFSSFGIAFYDFKLTPIVEEDLKYISAADNYDSIEEAFENKVPGVLYEVEDSGSSSMSYIQNPTSSSTSVSASSSKSVTNSLSTSFTESENYSYTESAELNIEVSPIKDRFKIGLKLGFSASQAFSTAFSEGTSVSETISTSTAASVTLPPYTEIGIKQTTSSVRQVLEYKCPVYVTYKVVIFGMNGEYAQSTHEWGHGAYEQGSICVGFGCDEILGGLNAADNLYKRFIASSPNFELEYGNVIGMHEFQNDGDDPIQLKYIDWNSEKAKKEDLKKAVINIKKYIPMSSVGGTMNVKTDTSGTEITHIYPMYDLKRIRFADTGAYTLGIGGKLDLNTVDTIGLNEFDREYYGFLARMGTWNLCDENGNDLPAYEAGKGITIEPTPTTQTIIANEIGDYYLRFDIDEKYYTKVDDRKTYITNDDLEMTAILKLSVTDTGNNHTCRPGGWITYIPANCVVEGERYRNCLTCSKRMATEVIPKADHIPVETVVPATCNTDGSKTTTCLTCKTVISNEVIPAKGHGSTYSVTTIAPTCTHDGEKALYCYDCNMLVGSEVIASTGHDNGVWKIDFEATPEHEGQMTKYCSTCNVALESKTFAYHTHSYTAWGMNGNGTHTRSCYLCSFTETANCDYNETVTDATCLADGETTYKCKDCSYKYTEINSYAQGHTWDTWTASDDGYHSASCTICGESERTVHVFVEYIPNNDATKDADGTKTATCVVCAAKDTIIDEGSKLVDTPDDSDTPVDGDCDHMCHKSGFIWKIVRFFWKLFKMNPVCECGIAHY